MSKATALKALASAIKRYDAQQPRDSKGRWTKYRFAEPDKVGQTVPRADERLRQQQKHSQTAFSKAPKAIRAVADKIPVNLAAPRKGYGAFYNPSSGEIHMNSYGFDKGKTSREAYQAIYRHEWGHMVDQKFAPKGSPYWSSSPQGTEAFKLDEDLHLGEAAKINLREAKKLIRKTGDSKDVKTTSHWEACKDIMAALTVNRVGNGHTDEYWKGKGNREAELFANVTALLSSGNPNAIKAAYILAPNFTEALYERFKSGL